MKRSKVLLSSVVAVAVVMLYSFSVYALPNVTGSEENLLLQQQGVLTSSGSVSVNSNAAQTGMTVVSGSSITTGANSTAVVDISGVARITIGDNTSAMLTYDPTTALVRTTCNETHVSVKQGTATVKLADGSTKTLSAGQHGSYNGSVDVTASAGSDVMVSCGNTSSSPGATTLKFGTVGLLGLLLLGGAAAGIAVAVSNSGSSGTRQPVSGFRP